MQYKIFLAKSLVIFTIAVFCYIESLFYEGEEIYMKNADIDYFRDLLRKMREDIRQKGESTIEDMTEDREMYADPADRASAESDRAFILRLRDRDRKLIQKIDQALGRIEEGSFGICDDCGEDISIARLKARPVTTLCIKCKSRQEKAEAMQGD